MKKYFLLIFFSLILAVNCVSSLAYAADIAPIIPVAAPIVLGAPVGQDSTALPQEGSWITDPTVTTIGKNAARSGMLLDWTLKDYKWASDSAYTNNPLVPLWQVIQRIVYALFLFVVLVTAFILIITRGRSLSAKRFLPRFFLVVLLVTFSFSLVQFLYQIVDIFQGFFLKNPAGTIISSKDLLYVGFDYKSFLGLRVFGQSYDESAFISLLLVKLTAFTYYVMVILLIFRKIILWFLIIVSPVFPLLLLFYPLRNTAKIWVGEFFRWLLYAPLFAIFLSGLVRLWHSGLPLVFNYTGVNNPTDAIYPTAINILLGGPGQNIGINNSVNLSDTFALYLVALIMLWAVIILPFILLQIFLDYMMAFNYQNNPFIKQVYSMLNNRPVTPYSPLPPGTPPPATTGLARSLPFIKRFEVPKTTGLAKQVPITTSRTIERPSLITRNNQTEISRLTNLSIPTMRDIARFETTKLSNNVTFQREIDRMRQTLVNIANPASVTTVTERDRFKMIRDRLVTEGQKGNQVASTVLNAATTYNSYTSSSQTTSSSISQQTQQLVQHLASPTTIISKRDQQKIIEVKQELGKAAKEGNQFATTILNSVNSYTTNQVTQLQQLLQGLAHPEKSTSTIEKETYTSLREKIISASKSGNSLATLIEKSMDSSTSTEQVQKIQDQLLEAKAQGNPLAAELLRTVTSSDKSTEKDMEKLHTTLQEASKNGDPLATLLLKTLMSEQKPQSAPLSANAKLKAGTLPQVNRIQQVSLDDYEAVKKMWKDNYKNVDVPQGVNGQQSRKDWITQDIASIEETVSLLSSANPQDVEKGMQEVSDILPFLLIGGFSQTEIIAYLKAKMEAGKNIVEEVSTETNEEDTLLDTKQVKKTEAGHMAASAEIKDEVSSSSSPSITNNSTVTNNYTTVNENTVETTTPQQSSSTIISDMKLLEKSELSIPKLSDIARLDTNAKDSSTAEITKIKTILNQLAHPEKITTSAERDRYTSLREEIVKESQQNDPLAILILTAIEKASGLPDELSPEEVITFGQTIEQIVNPSSDIIVNKEYVEVHNQFNDLSQSSDPLAVSLVSITNDFQTKHYDYVENFLQKLSNPTSLTTASEQMHFNKLVERVAQASEDGNPTASLLLKTVREPLTKESITNLVTTISVNAARGDNLATYINQSINTIPSDSGSNITDFYKKLRLEKDKNNPFATSLLSLFKKQLHASPVGLKVTTLPSKNRLQQVSVDDYETVKKLWSDNYQSAQTPTGITREQWIDHDAKDISDTINLLSLSDPAQVQLGMDSVGNILPFLLLGGFSKDEIIGYLKAKLEAGKDILKTTQTASESVKVPVKRSTSPQRLQKPAMTEELAISPNETSTASDADIFLLTLRCVLDPSLVSDATTQQNYRSAREMLTQARQRGDERAIRLMKLADMISQSEIESVSTLLSSLRDISQIDDAARRSLVESLKTTLARVESTNQIANALLKASVMEVTPVNANKIRVVLIEGQAIHDPLATEIMLHLLVLPEAARKQLDAESSSMLTAKNTDAFSILFIRLFNEQKEQQIQALRNNN